MNASMKRALDYLCATWPFLERAEMELIVEGLIWEKNPYAGVVVLNAYVLDHVLKAREQRNGQT
jgi:hypothetical protein